MAFPMFIYVHLEIYIFKKLNYPGYVQTETTSYHSGLDQKKVLIQFSLSGKSDQI